jgi:hypothetical protein
MGRGKIPVIGQIDNEASVLLFLRLKGGVASQVDTSTQVEDDDDERVRVVACVKRGVASSKKDDTEATLLSLQGLSGMNLEKLVDTPDELLVALGHLFGPGSALVFGSVRSELLLSSLGHHPLNGRIEVFLMALDKAKEPQKP